MLKRFTNIGASIETVDVETAKQYLERNHGNRSINKHRVDNYARDMQAGHWTPGSSIGFFENGELADGQHRLLAVVQSGVPTNFVVIRNLPFESKLNHNTGMVQTACASVKMTTGSNMVHGVRVNQASSFVRTIIEIEVGVKAALLTPSELIEKFDLVSDALSFIAPYVNSKRKGISAAAIWAAIIAAAYVSDKQKMSAFCEVFTGKRNAVNACESMVMRFAQVMITTNQVGHSARLEVWLKTQRCIKAFMDGQSLTKFYANEGTVYSLRERLGFPNDK